MEKNVTDSEISVLTKRGFKLISKLGEGSYAIVYLTECIQNVEKNVKKRVACKIINTENASAEYLNKFLPRELDILVKVNHPHIIHIHSIFQRHAKYYIVMRYAENGDVLEFILKNGPINEEQARVWTKQITLAVQYLHNMDIAHRDLKCENILITANYNSKLADFGFARHVKGPGKKALSSTYCGSLQYAAPEILRGLPYNPKLSDIWSIGVILFVMINKGMPFDDQNIKLMYSQQMRKHWSFRNSIVVDTLSAEVKTLMAHILEPETSKRATLNQILCSDWFKLDPRLQEMDPMEKNAPSSQLGIKKKYVVKNVKHQVSVNTLKHDQCLAEKTSNTILPKLIQNLK